MPRIPTISDTTISELVSTNDDTDENYLQTRLESIHNSISHHIIDVGNEHKMLTHRTHLKSTEIEMKEEYNGSGKRIDNIVSHMPPIGAMTQQSNDTDDNNSMQPPMDIHQGSIFSTSAFSQRGGEKSVPLVAGIAMASHSENQTENDDHVNKESNKKNVDSQYHIGLQTGHKGMMARSASNDDSDTDDVLGGDKLPQTLMGDNTEGM